MVGRILLITGFVVRIWMWIYAMSIRVDYRTSIMNDREVDLQVLQNLFRKIEFGIAYSYFFILLGTVFLIAGILKNRRALFGAMTVRDIIRSKWQFIVATVIGLSGALVGGFYGSFVAAFAGDSWWESDFALNFYQNAIAFGGVCLGAVPGAVWLLCLGQRWVLPFLSAAGCALLLPVFERMPMRNESMGLLYGGFVISGFVIGITIWLCGRRHVKTDNTQKQISNISKVTRMGEVAAVLALILLSIGLLNTDAWKILPTKPAAVSNPVPKLVPLVPKIEFLDVPELGKNYRVQTGMNMVWIAPGSFQMGDTTGNGGEDEKPVREVRLSAGFWLGESEVTQGQWQEVMKSNTCDPKGENLPMDNVNWNDAVEFCKKLTERERGAGRIPEVMEYRLPTEAQWEYACRAGTKGDYAGDLNAMAWYVAHRYVVDNGDEAQEVKTKRPNAWGLYDMHGNVKELCRDAYGKKLPGGTDPFVENGATRVCRGGSYNNGGYGCRSSARLGSDPDYQNFFDQGLRIAAVSCSSPK